MTKHSDSMVSIKTTCEFTELFGDTQMGEAAPNVILDAENFGSNCLKVKDFNNFRDDDPAGTEPMGQLSSFQETELANRDSLAKPSVGEDSVFPDEQ